MKALLWLALLPLMACAAPGQGEITLDPADPVAYRDHVHPLLEATCASLDCHGAFGRPLRLYSEIGLRLRVDLRDAPLTQEELDRNVASLLAVDSARVGSPEHLLLTKPLAEGAGGYDHVGEDLWPSQDDPAYRCVQSWMAGDIADASFATACADALAPVRLPDP